METPPLNDCVLRAKVTCRLLTAEARRCWVPDWEDAALPMFWPWRKSNEGRDPIVEAPWHLRGWGGGGGVAATESEYVLISGTESSRGPNYILKVQCSTYLPLSAGVLRMWWLCLSVKTPSSYYLQFARQFLFSSCHP